MPSRRTQCIAEPGAASAGRLAAHGNDAIAATHGGPTQLLWARAFWLPMQVRDFATTVGKRAKTDALDAAEIAHFVEALRPEPRPFRRSCAHPSGAPETDRAFSSKISYQASGRRSSLGRMRTGHQDSASGTASDVGTGPRQRRTSQTAPGNSPQAGMHVAPLRSTFGTIMRVRAVLAVLLVALTSCNTYMDGYPCTNPDKGHRDALNNPDPCHENDPGTEADAGEPCDGVCLPAPPAGWFGPYFFWMGDEADVPQCSDLPGVLNELYSGYGDLDAPTHCDACACAQPTGSCAVPATVTASAATCAGDGPGATHTPFNSPPKWDGTCTSANAIPPGKLCGGVPCVQSVTIAPLTLKESGCLPIQPLNVQPPPVWKKFGRACTGEAKVTHCETGGVCAPIVPSPQFKQCIGHDGDSDYSKCPPGYPERSVFYNSFTDNRSCEACACKAPTGSTCTGSISIFSDPGCGMSIGGSLQIDALEPQCLDLLPGATLGSKSASEPIFTPGQCAPSDSKPMDNVSLHTAVAWCCQGTP